MSDSIRLDVTASPSSLPAIRMVVGGVGAHVDLSLVDIEELVLAVEHLLAVADELGEGPRYAIALQVLDDGVDVSAGTFHSGALRQQLADGCMFGLCTILGGLLDAWDVVGADDESFTVTFTKRRGAA